MSIDAEAQKIALKAVKNYDGQGGTPRDRHVAKLAIEAYEAAKSPEQPDDWSDKPDQWQAAIDAAHPTITEKHKTYAKALEMVSNRHSKGSLVDLVNWLLAYRRPTEVPDVD